MADIDLTEAIAAGLKVTIDYSARRSDLLPSEENIVRAAAPLIEAQVRAQIAADIEALRGTDAQGSDGRIAISTATTLVLGSHDGLTDDERAGLAAEWRAHEGRRPSRSDFHRGAK